MPTAWIAVGHEAQGETIGRLRGCWRRRMPGRRPSRLMLLRIAVSRPWSCPTGGILSRPPDSCTSQDRPHPREIIDLGSGLRAAPHRLWTAAGIRPAFTSRDDRKIRCCTKRCDVICLTSWLVPTSTVACPSSLPLSLMPSCAADCSGTVSFELHARDVGTSDSSRFLASREACARRAVLGA
jgi:hypothetical protein